MTGASLAYFDGRLTEVAIKVATQAREMGIPVLVEGERIRDNLETLLKLGDHVCTSAGYPRDATGEETTETAMVKMLAELPNAKTLVTTLGAATRRGWLRRVDGVVVASFPRQHAIAATVRVEGRGTGSGRSRE